MSYSISLMHGLLQHKNEKLPAAEKIHLENRNHDLAPGGGGGGGWGGGTPL